MDILPPMPINAKELEDFWQEIVPEAPYVWGFPDTGDVLQRALVRFKILGKTEDNLRVKMDEVVWRGPHLVIGLESTLKDITELHECDVVHNRDEALKALDRLKADRLTHIAKEKQRLGNEVRELQTRIGNLNSEEALIRALTVPPLNVPAPKVFAGVEKL